MENKAHALLAGIFVLVVTLLLALLALWLTRDNTQRHLYEMSTGDIISGLQPQAAVRFRGVPVGKVESIGFDDKVKGNVLIRVSIDREAPITQSTFATVASQGVTGLGFIQLDDNDGSSVRLTPNDANPPRIPLKPGTLDKLLSQGEMILNHLEQASSSLNKLLSDENQRTVSAAVAQFGEATASLKRVSQGLEPTVAGLPALSRETSATLLSVKRASNEVASTAQRLNAVGGPLDKLTQGGTALAAGVETFSTATLPKLGEVADETARAMRQLRRTVSAVDDNPQALIFGNGPPLAGPGEPGFSATGVNP
ncbi:phospholipid/cholesterol/gamma-HCH transport system substrate-binding protein [Polaromonas sp. OV174]|uniref:MlaD family protein n=1 Tax=Polaromonas sp. OV174 TaxID=1855300 RepID=UPI0008DF4E88|nr:MlaD family protein [Polaromonas sp. OV174]SFB87212.1 phospholipid/cholesterol/gamma-HCH transport system substrate-binding protein [Polaromonas sp. OV174]